MYFIVEFVNFRCCRFIIMLVAFFYQHIALLVAYLRLEESRLSTL